MLCGVCAEEIIGVTTLISSVHALEVLHLGRLNVWIFNCMVEIVWLEFLAMNSC